MLSYTETVLRVALNRLSVKTTSLSRLLHVTSNLYRKAQPYNTTAGQSNAIVPAILEILADGLRMKARVLPSTLTSMLEVCCDKTVHVSSSASYLANFYQAITTMVTPGFSAPATTHLNALLALVDNGLHFLQNHVWSDIENDFTASLAVGKMVLQAANHDPNIMSRLSDHGQEVCNCKSYDELSTI